MSHSNGIRLLFAAAALTLAIPATVSAQTRGGSDRGRVVFQTATDIRRLSPTLIPPNAKIGPRANGVQARVLAGPANNPPYDGNANGTIVPVSPSTQVGTAVQGTVSEVLLPNGFRDAGRTLTPAAHLQRFPPPPAIPANPPTFTIGFPSRRDGILAPDLVRDQGGNAALRTLGNRREERNAFVR